MHLQTAHFSRIDLRRALIPPRYVLFCCHRHFAAGVSPRWRNSNSHKGFRSRNQNEGGLDREFSSFETAFSGPPLSDVHHHQPPPFFQTATPVPAQSHHPQPGVVGWADDFQKLQISERGPVAHPNQFQEPLHRTGTADWQNEFSRQPQQSTTVPGITGYRPGMAGMEFAGPSHFQSYHDAPQTHGPAAAETFDESAFEAAFAEARAEIELQENQSEQREEHETTEPFPAQADRIGSDRIPAHQEGINEADELAKTAGELLDSVSHDTSQKFKQSNFLALMRQLRDREVAVDGDKLRHVSTPP